MNSNTTQNVFSGIIAFIIPMVIAYFAYVLALREIPLDNKLSMWTLRTMDFDLSIFDSVFNDLSDLQRIRMIFVSHDYFYYPDAIRSILNYHFDPCFLLGLLVGGQEIYPIFNLLLIVRLGLIGFSVYYFFTKAFSLDELTATVFSTAFAVSMAVIEAELTTSVMNMLILLPWVILFADQFVYKSGLTNFLKATIAMLVFTLTGIHGVFPGILAIILIMILMICYRSVDSLIDIWDLIIRFFVFIIASAATCAVSWVPFIFGGYFKTNANSAFTDGKMLFPAFDFILRMFDGSVISNSMATKAPAIGIGVFVIMLVCLLFLNRQIPFGLKCYTGVLFAFIYLAVSYTPMTEFIIFDGSGKSIVYSIVPIFAFILTIVAAISSLHVDALTDKSVYAVIFALLAILVISNNSSQNVSSSLFSLYFSGISVIVVGAFLLHTISSSKGVLSVPLCMIILLGVGINTVMSIAPASFPKEAETQTFLETDSFLDTVFEEGNSYYVLSSGITDVYFQESPSDAVNMMARAMFLDDVYVDEVSYAVYYSGVSMIDEHFWSLTNDSKSTDINMRINTTDPNRRYFLSCSYAGTVAVKIIVGEDITDMNIEGPFLIEVPTQPDYVLVACNFQGNSKEPIKIKGVSLNEAAYEAFVSAANISDDTGILVERAGYEVYAENKGIVTSIPYSSRYSVVDINNPDNNIEVMNFYNKIAFNYVQGQFKDSEIKIVNSYKDLVIGSVISLSTVSALLIIMFMYNNIASKRSINDIGETEIVQQEDN